MNQKQDQLSENPVKVSALTAGKRIASSRFRIRQHIPRLAELGVEVREHIPLWGESCGLPSPFKTVSRIPALFTSRSADAVWISRELVQGYETFERLLKRPRVMDVDDAIWQRRPLGRWTVPHIARGMDVIIAGNAYLAEWFSRYCRQIYIVPTAINLNRYRPRENFQPPAGDKFVIGWTGQACNFKYLEMIEPALQRFMTDYPDSELLVIAQRPWQPKILPASRVRFTLWRPEIEAIALHDMSVGIMPLADDDWTRGKCSFKMLQYMAAGLPVAVSPVGMNRDILEMGPLGLAVEKTDDWYDILETLYKNPQRQIEMGRAGREVAQQHFSSDTIAGELARIFKSIAGKS